jgi:hypothetical protein
LRFPSFEAGDLPKSRAVDSDGLIAAIRLQGKDSEELGSFRRKLPFAEM